MATFNDFCSNIKKGFSKLGDQVEKVADTAALRIKLTGIDGKLAEYYTELGRLTYAKLRGTAPDDVDKGLDTLMTKIDGKMAEKREAEEELERARAAKEGEKTEYEARAEEPTEPAAEEAATDAPKAE